VIHSRASKDSKKNIDGDNTGKILRTGIFPATGT
jgi:hypothetical protein